MSAYLTLEQVSAQTHAPVKTIRWWIHTRRLAAYKPGRHLLVKAADLEAFIERASVVEKSAERVKRARATRRGTRS